MSARLWIPALFVTLVIAANWFTIDVTPRPWLDEAMFADPGLNLADGHGFASGWWPGQSRDEVFASNAPLYSLVIGAVASVVGPNLFIFRLLNWILLGIAALVIIAALQRKNLLTDWRSELVLIFLLYGGYVMTVVYRSARYDVLGLLLCAILFAIVLLPRRRFGWILLVGVAALIPATGLHLIPFLVVACGLRLVIDPDRKRALIEGGLVGLGLALGGAALLAILSQFGVAGRLFDSTSSWSSVGGSLAVHLQILTAPFRRDPSTLILLTALLVLSIIPATRSAVGWRAWVATVGFAILVPLAMAVAGRYAVYYAWMAFVPLAIIMAIAFDRLRLEVGRTAIAALSLVIIIAGYGMFGRIYVAVENWHANDAAFLEAAVHEWVKPSDAVYSTHLTYFAVRQISSEIYGDRYFFRTRHWNESVDIDVLLVAPDEAPAIITRLGGEWELVGDFTPRGVAHVRDDPGIGHAYHRVVAYRRVGEGTDARALPAHSDVSPGYPGRLEVVESTDTPANRQRHEQ